MTEEPPGPVSAGGEPAARRGALYRDSTEALQFVREDFNYWTGRLTDTSFQLSLGVLAANWAVFGSVRDLLANGWAKASVTLVIVGLGLNVIGAKVMGELHRKRVEYASENLARWEDECKAALGRSVPWPFTQEIVVVGRVLREVKACLPIVAGLLFVIAVLAR